MKWPPDFSSAYALAHWVKAGFFDRNSCALGFIRRPLNRLMAKETPNANRKIGKKSEEHDSPKGLWKRVGERRKLSAE